MCVCVCTYKHHCHYFSTYTFSYARPPHVTTDEGREGGKNGIKTSCPEETNDSSLYTSSAGNNVRNETQINKRRSDKESKRKENNNERAIIIIIIIIIIITRVSVVRIISENHELYRNYVEVLD